MGVNMLKKEKTEKYLVINNWGVVYNTINKTMTAGKRVRDNKLIIDLTVTDIEEYDLWIAVIIYEELYSNSGAIVSSFENLMNEYLLYLG